MCHQYDISTHNWTHTCFLHRIVATYMSIYMHMYEYIHKHVIRNFNKKYVINMITALTTDITPEFSAASLPCVCIYI